jgi:hypothetical protein
MIQLRGTVSLTDRQASWIRRYADALPTASRGPFIEFVKDRLVGEPGDLAVAKFRSEMRSIPAPALSRTGFGCERR